MYSWDLFLQFKLILHAAKSLYFTLKIKNSVVYFDIFTETPERLS